MPTAARASREPGTIQLQRFTEALVEVPIIGRTPIISHRWSEKAVAMLPGHPDRAQLESKKGPHQPEEEAEAALYRLEDGRPAAPASSFKAAMVGACRFFGKKLSMTEAKLLFFVEADGIDPRDGRPLVAIDGRLELREDMPRITGGTAVLRYLYQIADWRAELRIRFLPLNITSDSIATLVDAAGRLGVGDWRPSSPKSATGSYGTWQVPT